jgi:hypothetical protein
VDGRIESTQARLLRRADVQNKWLSSVRYSPRTKGSWDSRPSTAAYVVVVSTRNERRLRILVAITFLTCSVYKKTISDIAVGSLEESHIAHVREQNPGHTYSAILRTMVILCWHDLSNLVVIGRCEGNFFVATGDPFPFLLTTWASKCALALN